MERLLLQNADRKEKSSAYGKVDKQIAEGFDVGVLEAMFRNGFLNRIELVDPCLAFIRGHKALGVDLAG
jgi:hypothetical protein